MTPEELVAIACPKIRDMGWAYYFVPPTIARGEELGLDTVSFYVLGRGGVLGDVEAGVIVSAFGYFEPSMLAAIWDKARTVMAPRDAARAYMECCAQLGRDRFSTMDDLEGFCAAAGAVHDAADPVGLALYAGFACEPLVEDLPGRAMQLVSVLRELRGSAHLLAVRASGLDGRTAHFISRPNDVAMFGWSDDDPPVITDAERAKLAAAERLTDEIVLPAYAVLDQASQSALLGGLEQMEAAFAATP